MHLFRQHAPERDRLGNPGFQGGPFFVPVRPSGRGQGPVLGAPVLEVPLFHVGIALIVDVVKRSLPGDEVRGVVVDVPSRRIQQAAHGLYLFPPDWLLPPGLEQLRHRGAGDVLLQEPFLPPVHRQEPGHGDAQLPQRGVVPRFGGQLVTEGIVLAGLVVDLL